MSSSVCRYFADGERLEVVAVGKNVNFANEVFLYGQRECTVSVGLDSLTSWTVGRQRNFRTRNSLGRGIGNFARDCVEYLDLCAFEVFAGLVCGYIADANGGKLVSVGKSVKVARKTSVNSYRIVAVVVGFDGLGSLFVGCKRNLCARRV